MFANLVCPAKFLHYLQPSEYYISNTKVKEPDHEFQALLTNQRLLFLEGTQKKVRWSKRLRELITMDAVPENPQNLCITYHQDQEEAKEEEQSGKSILVSALHKFIDNNNQLPMDGNHFSKSNMQRMYPKIERESQVDSFVTCKQYFEGGWK
eukprot:TRINITY_DN1262_c1_g1_i1.p2 TRINITY_DN1262_c1_g1~~TRINITY_DN1262_c1_g1_i1.p2  ORF type:complete len:152 (-),score=31.39 TRINITY_DN1262_c1_g1_i1:804-1259(-)